VGTSSIARIGEDAASRPFWSVMIPVYNPRVDYLSQAIGSVLAQDQGSERMQIEVLDDCSSEVDVAEIVGGIAGEKIAVSRTAKNLGLAGCWNMCIEKSRGIWVHILHQDDLVLPGFYEKAASASALHPDVSLIASRSFEVDDQGIIKSTTRRLINLESGGRVVTDFYYSTPIQCPGVVVKRSAYEQVGGFRHDLKFALDCEMWARIITETGGLILPDVLAQYRSGFGSESNRLWRSSDALADLEELNRLFKERYPEFDLNQANRRICKLAISQAERLAERGDREGELAIWRYWRKHVSTKMRLQFTVSQTLRGIAARWGLSFSVGNQNGS
jgi:glycosyltransferase involved in cell wall biosynthesis